MKKTILLTTIVIAALTSCNVENNVNLNIVPRPNKTVALNGEVALTGQNLTKTIDTTLGNAEAYRLTAKGNSVEIVGGSEAGLFYGLQTLEQITKDGKVPAVIIEDSPRFAWRGMMLDVSRHIQDKEFVKQFIDMLAFHKLNKFHWHLTDGIGWRIEIDQYPKLTTQGAYRRVKNESVPWIGFQTADAEYKGERYGGYFTKADVREIVEYAKARYIEVIPEIEMPGHSMAAIECYPEYTCPNAQKSADVYCAGNDGAFEFLQNIIDELVELFPSKYIHIGGDEVGKEQWSQCPVCKVRKEKEGLKDEHELQSYFVKRMEKYINSKGKSIIGWDEISQGGLAPNATVMSWTGWEGGIKAANAGHDVIMVPLDYVYLDHYQGYNSCEPQAWGGYNGLKRVYEFPVIPEGIQADKEKHIIGGQGNLWTETIITSEHIEYMLFPRMAALSEALWSTKEKNWEQFAKTIDVQLDRYKDKGWQYAESALTPMVKSQTADSIELFTELGNYEIFYIFDKSLPVEQWTKYTGKIELTTPGTLTAIAKRNGVKVGYQLTVPYLRHKATGKKVNYTTPYSDQYNGGGDRALVDNRYAIKRGDDKSWQGFCKDNIELTIDLGAMQQVSQVYLRFFQHISTTSVLLPLNVSVELSANGMDFKKIYDSAISSNTDPNALIEDYTIVFAPQQAQYVRLKAKNIGKLYTGHPRAGDDAWLFMDEVVVN